MQIGTQGTPDLKVSGGTTSNFKIEASALSFKFLSTGLYSRKIEAVIRELACNGYDAHIAAGKPHQPFEIHLPTYFEPHFSINDFGTGLRFVKGGCEKCSGTGKVLADVCDDCDGTGDYDGMMRLLCTYFASNKRHSNELIGALGLGSKSPFAYLIKENAQGEEESAGFTVTNRYEGKTYFYTARLVEGTPAATLTSMLDTPEAPNGVEIQFPVETKDIWEFENTAKYVFEFFQPKPVFVGEKSVTIVTPTYSVHNELWGMRTVASTTQTSGLRAIAGVVAYSVGNIDQSRLTEAQKKLVTMPIDLFFKVGELSPAASRETLQLDPKTVSNILTRLDAVQDKLMEEIKAKVDACPTGWEARLKIHELMMQPGMGALVNDAFNKGQLDGKYSNFKLNGAKVTVNELDYNNITAFEFRYNDRARRKAKKESLFETADNNRRAAALRDVASGVSKKSDYEIKFDVDERTVFIIHDLPRGSADKYVNHMLQKDPVLSSKYRTAIVLQRVNSAVAMNRAGNEAVALVEKVGNPPTIQATTLKAQYDPLFKAEKAQKIIKRERMNVRMLERHVQYTRRSNGSTGWKKQWRKGDDHPLLADPTAIKFYIKIDRNHEGVGLTGNRFYYGRTFVEFVNKVRDTALFPEITSSTPVFGIKVGSNLLNDPTFVEITSFVKARLEADLTPAKQMAMSLTVNPFSCNWTPVLDYVAEHPMVLSVDSPVRQFALALDKAKKIERDDFTNLTSLAAYFGITISNTADYGKAWEKVEKMYPMLKFCSRKSYHSCSIEEKNAFVDYIRSVDKQNALRNIDPNKQLVLTNVVAIDEVNDEAADEMERER